jgi:uncharacterized protein YndB with AHSA1/START domain
MDKKPVVIIETTVNAPVGKVWDTWTTPEHITKWNSASPDWHTTSSTNDVREGGKFSCRMEAKDGSMGFEFGGSYDVVREKAYLEYTLGDGRKVEVIFSPFGDTTRVTESFEAEGQNPVEMQRVGWQAILDNFKKYTEELDA